MEVLITSDATVVMLRGKSRLVIFRLFQIG